MFKIYLKIAWRSLWKNKGYSALNIFGLAIGITCACIILLWVEDEVSYNTHFPKKDYVYYVPTNQYYDGEWRTFFEATPGPFALDVKNEIPEIVRAARTKSEDFLFTINENTISRNGRYTDVDLLEMFSLQFLEGNKENAFSRPDAIIITQQTANQLFGEGNKVLGKVLKVNNEDNYTITGVIQDLPKNVTYDFDWLVPFERFTDQEDMEFTQQYGANFADTFIELAPGADFNTVAEKVKRFIPEKTDETDTEAILHSMNDWHLRNVFKDGKQVGGQIVYIRLFLLIALIILVIACINFMNLATARSEKRANEVGVRKVLGSGKKKLIGQFITEALITSFLSAFLSIGLLFLLLPRFNLIVDKQLAFEFSNITHVLALLAIALVCGLFAGWYPAFYLSAFKPVEVLKGLPVKKGSAAAIRKGLVITQFAASIVFIISTIIVYQQVDHVKNRELGYETKNLIRLPVNGTIVENFEPIEQDLKNTGLIRSIGLNNSQILSSGNNTTSIQWPGGNENEDKLISYRYVTHELFETVGMHIKEGRGFGKNIVSDSTNVVVTESFAKLMGTDSAIGKTISAGDDNFTVIGVVNDYQYGDMYGTSDPVVFFHYRGDARYLYAKPRSGVEISSALTTLEEVLAKHNPAFPFEYQFVDKAFDAKFKSEQLVGSLSKTFALLAIVISCLGLFGLSAYTAEQRRKEIGVRKVLGSSVTNIVQLLSKDFMRLVLISYLIAGPVAWWIMYNWLQGYAYRIEISGWVFLVSGMLAITIALATVSFQAVKAAIANPVKSLRTE